MEMPQTNVLDSICENCVANCCYFKRLLIFDKLEVLHMYVHM